MTRGPFALYSEIETIHVGARSVVERARRIDTGDEVAIKRLAAGFPSPGEVVRLQREHDLAKRCAGGGVVAMRAFHARDGAAWIEMDLVPAPSLAERFKSERPSTLLALRIARSLVDALDVVHRQGVVHRDVSPENVILGDEQGAVTLIDFGVASRVVPSAVTRVERIEGTLEYMAPEQTGRVNRPVDRRADYYALGATLYQLLTGRPPFIERDASALVHAHVARHSLPPSAARSELPAAVDAVVTTLLAKRPDDRYQSAQGIAADLDACIEAIERGDTLEGFCPREHDLPDTLRIPDQLYGRAEELATLEGAAARARAGGRVGAIVRGAPGVGKSALVAEAQRAAAQQGATVISGKFEQFQTDTPFSAITAALRERLRAIMALTPDEVARARDRVGAALGELAAVLSEAMPELATVLGAMSRPPELRPAEAERRYLLALRALLGSLGGDDGLTVLTLDDLQWADMSSAAFIASALTDPSLRSVLLLVAWRGNEVGEGHPVARALRAARALGAEPVEVEVAPLREVHLRALLRETLRRDDEEVETLSRRLHAWTGGNPFLLHRALRGLNESGLIRFSDGAWRWRIDEVALRGLGVDAAAFVAGRIAELPAATRGALEVASCFAGSIDEGDLAAVLGVSRRALRTELVSAIDLGFIYPEQAEWWPEADDSSAFTLAFTHDRVREAARSRVSSERATSLHLALGRRLRSREAEVFQTAHHLNLAEPLLTPEEREATLSLDLVAGRRALRSGAFLSALTYFELALDLFPGDAWETRRAERLEATLSAARVASQAGDRVKVERLLADALTHAVDPLERAAALEIRALDLAGIDGLRAIDTALDALAELGVEVPRRPEMSDVQAALGEATGAILSRGEAEVLALPELSDPKALAVLRLANAIFAPSYIAVPLLMPILAAVIVRQSLALGTAPQSTYGFAILSVVLTSAGMYDPGFKIAQLSLKLMDRFAERFADVRSAHVLWGFVLPFTHTIDDAVAAHRSYHPKAMASGDHEYVAWIAHLSLANAFYASTPLDAMLDDLERETREMIRLGQRAPYDCTEPFRRSVRALRGLAPDPASLNDADFDADATLQALIASGARGAAYVLQTQRMILSYFAHDLRAVLDLARDGAPFEDGASCTYHVILFHQILALTHADLASSDAEHLEPARAHRARLEGAAAHAPHNHRHRMALIDAELARVTGDPLGACDGYDAAIAAARAAGFVFEEALANELAARHHLARGSTTSARAYLAESCVAYSRWGATAKLAALRAELPQLAPPISGDQGTVDLADAELDLSALSKASLAITSELRTEQLVERVLQVCVESAGATRGALLLRRGDELAVVSSRGSGAPEVGVGTSTNQGVAARIIRYAHRKGEALLISNALRDKRFVDASEAASGELSVMACPLWLNGELVGLIYLENDLSAEVFTERRRRLVELLGAQAAIAVENARLYDDTERLARSAARFVPTEFIAHLGRERLADVAPADAAALEMSALFVDLRGFTGLTERLGPAETFALLNEWLRRLDIVVREHGGFIKDVVGDGALALFSGDAAMALRAAIDVAALPGELAKDRPGAPKLRVGIGIDHGPVTLGTLGSERRLAISVVGDVVNTAARLESATKGIATQVLVSQRLVSRLGAAQGFSLRRLGAFSLHGRSEPIEVVELLDVFDPGDRREIVALLEVFQGGLAALRGGRIDEARAAFTRCVTACPADRLAASLLERIARGHGLGGKDDVELV